MARNTGGLAPNPRPPALGKLPLPPALEKKVQTFRQSLAAIMGEPSPKPLLAFDSFIAKQLERNRRVEPAKLQELLTDSLESWRNEPREEFYGLTTEQLRESLLKLEDLSFREGVRLAMEDEKVVQSMYVLLTSGNADYRKGAIFTLEEVAKKDVEAVNFDLFRRFVLEPESKEEGIALIENATEFGRILAHMLTERATNKVAKRLMERIPRTENDGSIRVVLKAYTHLSRVNPDLVEMSFVAKELRSANDLNRETAARIVQNMCKARPAMVDGKHLDAMAHDLTWAVRQVAAHALANLAETDPKKAQDLVKKLGKEKDEGARKVAAMVGEMTAKAR